MEIIKGFTFKDHVGKNIYVREDEDFLLHSISTLLIDGDIDDSEKEYGYSINGRYFITSQDVVGNICANTNKVIQEGFDIHTRNSYVADYDTIRVLDLNDIELLMYKDLNSPEKLLYFIKCNNTKEYPLTYNAANSLLEIVE